MKRTQIDAWPVATSGLASRPVTCLTRAGIATIGELRSCSEARLLELPAFGGESLRNVRWFFGWTQRLETGAELLPDLHVWLDEFLTTRQLNVVEQRFGLTDPLFRPWLKRPTLREIGDGLSRERIRQVEEEGLARLQTELARALIEPLRSQLATAQRGAVVLGGYEPWGAKDLLDKAFTSP